MEENAPAKRTATDHGKVTKNTLFLATRQIVVMVVALFTSRVILQAMGVVDFGVYNVVAGVSTSFLFFSATLAVSTQRFLSYEMGAGHTDNLRRVFSISFWSYAAIGAAVVVIGLAIGPWLVYHVLNIPPDRMAAALIVFYATVISFSVLMVFSVYEAVLIARENMKIYAYLGLGDALVKLSIAFLIMISPEKLITYGLLMVVATLAPRIAVMVYCRRRYAESHPARIWDKAGFKKLMGFAGWNVYDNLAWFINSEGLNVTLNIFFGPVVNAARGVAQQVNGAVINFSMSFFTAVRPQIIKNYAAGAMEEVRSLLSMSSRGTFFIMWAICLPLIMRAPQVMSLWLVEVPQYAVVFLRWTLVFLMVNSLTLPMAAVTQATGHMRRYAMFSINAYILAFPVSICLLVAGCPAWSIYPCIVVARFISALLPLYTLRPYVHITLWFYIRRVLVPITATVAVTLAAVWALNGLYGQTFGALVLFSACSLAITVCGIYFLGMDRGERNGMKRKVLARFVKKK